jgi:mannosyltransferase
VTALSDPPAPAAAGPDPAASSRRNLLVGLGIVVGLAGLFCYFYTRSDLWLDEALSVNIARLPLGDLRAALKQDGAPPLYYLLLHVWTSVFGTSAVAVRSLSGVCMLGAVGVMWFVARRIGGSKLAWLVALLMISNPYAIRYATEARMYALMVLLVACGILFFQRTVERPTIGRAACFGVVVVLAIYTQYWAFFLLVTVVALFAWMVWRDHDRRAARYLLVATGIGLLTFLPWTPTFLYQRAHTGTPWGTPVLPSIPIAYTLRDFAGGNSGNAADRQEGWMLFFVLLPLLLLGVFGRGVDRRGIELDLRTRPKARMLAFVGGVGLLVALTLNYLGGGAFQSRYSSIVFPFFIVLVAMGLLTFLDTRILVAIAVVATLFGFAGGVRNVVTQRTQAGQVAAVLRAQAKPGDVVVYCPDQVAPAVHRLAPKGLNEVVYPSFAPPERIDWVDYKKRLAQAKPGIGGFARQAEARAGSHTLWYVSAPGYITHTGVCEALGEELSVLRNHQLLVVPNPDLFEKPGLVKYTPRHAGG